MNHADAIALATLNRTDQQAFVAAIGFVFEDTPWVAARTWHARPFERIETLHEALCHTMYAGTPAEHLALIRAHPDLAGRAAQQGRLGTASAGEHRSAGLDRLTAAEQAAFARLNTAYWERFGFPFIICAREHTRQSMLANFEARLANTMEQEIATALHEITRIAGLRLRDAVRP